MDNANVGGVKVTYIETQFVTSDAAGFKDLVQRLTGRSASAAAAPPVPPHRPRPCRPGARGGSAAAEAAPHGCGYPVGEVRPAVISHATPPYLEDMGLYDIDIDMDNFDLICVGASEYRGACAGTFPY